ncbi:MAG: hypothetical protein FJ319_07140 [SAR202 cluster bacterium]|nr:hypothetical protein [SAR202 cluster bacterium]
MTGMGLVVVAVVLIILGVLVQSDLISWLLNVIGFVLIASGIIVGIVGLVQVVTGRKGSRL